MSTDIQQIKLIYIASNGRSGSTLLDLILGNHPNIWTLGEFHWLPWELKLNWQPCGCGQKVSSCIFWDTIVRKHADLLENGSIQRFRLNNFQGKVLRFDELPFIFQKKLSSENRRDTIAKYGEENAQILHDVWLKAHDFKEEQLKWLVDASKDCYRLFWLIQSNFFDLRVIHLKKVPSAFVYSMTRNSKGIILLRKIIRMTGRWIVENYLIEQICNRFLQPEQVFTLFYEDLATKPEQTVEKLVLWLKLPLEPRMVVDFRSNNHAIGGNIMRHQKESIHLDERWKIEMPLYYQWFVKMITFHFSG